MDPLSITASLLSVLEAAAVVSKTSIALYRGARDAPKELAFLANQILRTQARLDVQVQVYQSLKSSNVEDSLPDEAVATLNADIENAKVCLESIQNMLSASSGHSSNRQRFGWVIQDKRKFNKLLDNLRDIDNNLSAMLTTISL
ncbi:MAG: hypothetical protein Q9168_003336 [Polycauliona sp. 1 TL-2023]